MQVHELEQELARVAGLEDRHARNREVTALRRALRPATIEAAAALLNDAGDEGVRRIAAELLGVDVGDRMAAERLQDAALMGEGPEALEAVAIELGRLRATEGLTTLRGLAVHDDDAVRRAAAQGLGSLAEAAPGAVDMLVVLSGDADPAVRGRATHELGRAPDSPAVRDALAARLDDEDLDARFDAARALGERGDPRALPVVVDLADTRFDHATHDLAAVRLAAATGDARLAAWVRGLDASEWRASEHAADFEAALARLS